MVKKRPPTKKVPRKRKKTKLPQNLTIAVWFFIAVTLLILLSFFAKAFFVLKRSAFDGSHRFTIAMSTSPSETVVYSFAPDSKTQTTLHIRSSFDVASLEKTLSLPIDVVVLCKENSCRKFIKDTPPSTLRQLLFHYNDLQTQATGIDFLRLYILTKTIPKSHSVEKTISLQEKAGWESMLSSCCIDYQITKDNETIAIVNESAIKGLGNRLGKLLSNIGATVISIDSSDTDRETSEIVYSGEKTYTVDKLQKILKGAKLSIDKKGISDIIVRIGKDQAQTNRY